MALTITYIPKVKKSCDQETSCEQKCNFCWKNSDKIWDCHSHPYSMWKSSNIVRVTLVKIFVCSIIVVLAYIVSIFFQTYKFLIDHHCETKSESSDSAAFIRTVRCSCRVFKRNLADRFDICEILQWCL